MCLCDLKSPSISNFVKYCRSWRDTLKHHWNRNVLRTRCTHKPRAAPKGRKISFLARKVLYLYQNKILGSFCVVNHYRTSAEWKLQRERFRPFHGSRALSSCTHTVLTAQPVRSLDSLLQPVCFYNPAWWCGNVVMWQRRNQTLAPMACVSLTVGNQLRY
jgi:hypothetical protein